MNLSPALPNLELFSALAASALLSAVWQGTLLAAIVALSLRLLPPVSAAVRSCIWLAAFGFASLLDLTPLLAARTTAPTASHTLHATYPALHLDLRWSLLLAATWLVLSAVRASQLAVSALHLRGIVRGSIPVPHADLPVPQADLPGPHAALPVQPRRRALLCTSTQVDRPSVAGFLSPRILLPPDLLATLTPAELEQVLLHETEHLRRGDVWTNLLQKLALVLFPLNPVLLWIEGRLCFERELACDDRVLRATAARKTYARCLTQLAEHTLLERSLTLALGAWGRQPELTRRVLRILRPPQRTLSHAPSALVSGGLIAGLLAATLSLAHTPEIVSFLPPAAALTAANPAGVATAPAGFHYASAIMSHSVAHEVLTNAVLPAAPPAAIPTHRPLRWQTTATRRHSALTDPQPSLPQPALPYVALQQSAAWTLTLARPLPGAAPGPAPAAQTTSFRPTLRPAPVHLATYAAVPFANGWLIIKL